MGQILDKLVIRVVEAWNKTSRYRTLAAKLLCGPYFCAYYFLRDIFILSKHHITITRNTWNQ